jgi:hypothetical protein
LQILLLYLLKQHAEKQTTRSWDISGRNAVRAITSSNKRRKAGGDYLHQDELLLAIDEAYENALGLASPEAFEGVYEPEELAKMINETQIRAEALRSILQAQ